MGSGGVVVNVKNKSFLKVIKPDRLADDLTLWANTEPFDKADHARGAGSLCDLLAERRPLFRG